MNILFDTSRFRVFQTALLQRKDGEELVEASDVLSETSREYAIPVVTVTEATVEHVSSIFERINNTGTKLTVFDLMVAATWNEQFDLRDEIENTLSDMERKDFDEISPVSILQVLAAIETGSANKKAIFSLRDKDPELLLKYTAEVHEALKRSIDFLVNEVNVKSSDFLPYERQLVVLAYVFAKHRSLSHAEISTLKKWFWRTSFAERYRRGGEGLFDEDLAKVIAALKDESLLARFGEAPSPAEIKRAVFRKNSALSNAFAALLASKTPRNLVNGTVIDTGNSLSKYNRKEFHHIFPQAYLRDRNVSKESINSLANICILSSEQNKSIGDKPPSVYFKEIQKKLGENWISTLESNLISQSSIECLLTDNFDEFINRRSERIESIIKSFI